MLQSIVTLIVDTIAGLLAVVLLLRFWMQVVRVRPPMSVAHFTFKLSDWLVKPLRRIVPGAGGYDWASLLGAFLIALLSIIVTVWLFFPLSVQLVLLLSLLRFIQWIFYGFMGLIIVEVIFSWVNPHAPLAPFVGALTEPLLRPLRRVLPLIGNIDLSPLVALLLLQIGLRVVSAILPGMM
ncbi:YggT family protein [Paucimonas lemoignei]|uniref:YggT family protein n=1 Tax=Paucimonas lemoignei TaxID=29443 RepID=A0A4R3HUI3_PAULE|nr:YggT family protein [Paucimonas lemoignei]TCS36886.1 YggT family protein [Paucimonas lemoignei]